MMNRIARTTGLGRVRAARLGTAFASVMLAISVVGVTAGVAGRTYASGTPTGAVSFIDGNGPTITGGSGAFTMQLPSGAHCQGSGASGYRWESFIVSASVDPATLTWADGPNAVAGALVSRLYSTIGDPVSTKQPSNSPLGLISGIPETSLGGTLASLPVGDYKIGIACQFSGATQEFWVATITVTANVQDTPLGIQWDIAAPTTTTTTAPTTTAPVTTAAATVTTVAIITTTTAVDSSGQVPVTGTNPAVVAMWALLVLVMGRMALLSGRRVKVLPPRAR
ncbi:MAG: hypothetical protein F2868_00810 [Actinobacteria bacterium]|nr:hypothetical protein [Actinomycetota bacterium]